MKQMNVLVSTILFAAMLLPTTAVYGQAASSSGSNQPEYDGVCRCQFGVQVATQSAADKNFEPAQLGAGDEYEFPLVIVNTDTGEEIQQITIPFRYGQLFGHNQMWQFFNRALHEDTRNSDVNESAGTFRRVIGDATQTMYAYPKDKLNVSARLLAGPGGDPDWPLAEDDSNPCDVPDQYTSKVGILAPFGNNTDKLVFLAYACTAGPWSPSSEDGNGVGGGGGSDALRTRLAGLNRLGNLSGGYKGAAALVIGRIIQFMLSFIGSIALLMFVYAGLTWMFSAGNPERAKKAANILVWSALGVIVAISSYGLVSWIFAPFG